MSPPRGLIAIFGLRGIGFHGEDYAAAIGVECERNKQAFSWGRLAAHQPDKIPKDAHSNDKTFSQTLDEVVDRRVEYLTAYQNQQYADRYKRLVAKALDAERSRRHRAPGRGWHG